MARWTPVVGPQTVPRAVWRASSAVFDQMRSMHSVHRSKNDLLFPLGDSKRSRGVMSVRHLRSSLVRSCQRALELPAHSAALRGHQGRSRGRPREYAIRTHRSCAHPRPQHTTRPPSDRALSASAAPSRRGQPEHCQLGKVMGRGVFTSEARVCERCMVSGSRTEPSDVNDALSPRFTSVLQALSKRSRRRESWQSSDTDRGEAGWALRE